MSLLRHMSPFAVPLIALGLVLPFPTVAAGEIIEVTVYPDRAQVLREHAVTLDEGVGIVRIHPLPAQLNPASLRVHAEGPEGLRLQHVETRTVHGRDLAHPDARALDQVLQDARDDRRQLTDGKRALTLKLDFIERLTENAGAVEPALPPDQWHRAWGLVSDGALDTLEQMTGVDAAIRDIDAEIDRIEREIAALRTDLRDTIEATIHYETVAGGPAVVRLEYEVPGASWSPFYEARLNTLEDEMEWVQRAEVRQNTGEEWRDVALFLSTARPALGGHLPELHPWFVDIAPPPQPRLSGRAEAMDMMAAPAAAMESAVLETTGFTSQYRVPNTISLPADNRQQRFLLDTRSHAVELSARSVPTRSTNAYLFAETIFDGPTPMLPGPVNLFQDEQLVGQTRIGAVAPGAELRLAFGVDDRIEIRHELDRDIVGREGLLRRQQRLERGYRIIINNHHERALRITVLDQLPVPRDERIKVELTQSSTTPTEHDVDGRPGVLAWSTNLDAGGEKEIRFGYTVSWPEEIDGIHGLRSHGQ